MTGQGRQQKASSGAPLEAGRLERGYRRLLFFYPARYRREHQEEILAGLMTAALEGKRRPGIAEAADLIWGALRVRFQPQRLDGVLAASRIWLWHKDREAVTGSYCLWPGIR